MTTTIWHHVRHFALWRRISKHKYDLGRHSILDLWTNSLGFVSVRLCKGLWRNGVGHRIWRERHWTQLDFSGRLYCSANCKFSSSDYLWFFLVSLTLVSLWADVMEENSFGVFVTRTLASETLIRCKLLQFSCSLIFSMQCVVIHFIQILPTSTQSCHSVHNNIFKTLSSSMFRTLLVHHQ